MDPISRIDVYNHTDKIDLNTFFELFGQGVIRAVSLFFAIVIVSFLAYILSHKTKKWLRSTSSYLLFFLFAVVWSMGFISYSIGAHVGESNPFFSNAPMAMIHATLMFAAQSDISAIKSDCADSPLFMCLYNISHISAVLLSFMLVLRHFGFHIVSKLRLFFNKHFGGKKDHLYIFWGFNDAAFALAKSLLNDEHRRQNCRVLVVRTDDEEESLGTQMAIKRFFRVISLKNRELNRLEYLDCLNVSSFARLSKLDVDVSRDNKWDILRDMLHLSCIPKLISKTTKSVNFFLLNNASDANCKALENLLHDSTIIGNKHKINIYCHARRTQLTDIYNTYEKYNPERVRIHILDSSELSIKCLKTKEYALPINHLPVDTTSACVTSSFDATIIGFGETGQDALSFLYEFSALPDKDGKQIKRHFTIVDSRTKELESEFWFNHPGLNPQDSEISFEQAEICKHGFYNNLNQGILQSHYFVIALDDDELNMNVATTIFDTIYRSTQKPAYNISIFVKTYDQDKYKWMKRIAKNKNSGDKNFPCTIRIFGSIEEVFDYDMIIGDKLLRNAQLYNWTYESVCNSKLPSGTPEEIWISSFGNVGKRVLKYQDKGKVASRAEVAQEFLRKTEQNISNTLHISTKLRLLGIASTDTNTICMLNKLIETRKFGHLEYYNTNLEAQDALSEWNNRLLNCAKCEHLRWNASHLMLGYKATDSYSDETNDRTKCHKCLRSWEELEDYPESQRQEDLQSTDETTREKAKKKSNDETRSYDSCVVDTSIRISYDQLRS